MLNTVYCTAAMFRNPITKQPHYVVSYTNNNRLYSQRQVIMTNKSNEWEGKTTLMKK